MSRAAFCHVCQEYTQLSVYDSIGPTAGAKQCGWVAGPDNTVVCLECAVKQPGYVAPAPREHAGLKAGPVADITEVQQVLPHELKPYFIATRTAQPTDQQVREELETLKVYFLNASRALKTVRVPKCDLKSLLAHDAATANTAIGYFFDDSTVRRD